MKVVFLGVGEAFDEKLPNNSHLVLSDTVLLLDCGYTVPQQVWKYNSDQSFLDAIYISHTHADHYFGIPALLTRMWEEKRKKPLTIICPEGSRKTVEGLIEYGYSGISERFEFPMRFIEGHSSRSIRLNEYVLSFAPTSHPANNHALKIRERGNSVCYSGDGMFTRETERLYRNADLVIHEAYVLDAAIPNHACVRDLLQMAIRNHVRCLALTHLQREFRKKGLSRLKKKLLTEELKVIVPEPFEEYVL